jgi:hypothetical protein
MARVPLLVACYCEWGCPVQLEKDEMQRREPGRDPGSLLSATSSGKLSIPVLPAHSGPQLATRAFCAIRRFYAASSRNPNPWPTVTHYGHYSLCFVAVRNVRSCNML